MDLFVVPTIGFDLLSALVIVRLVRRAAAEKLGASMPLVPGGAIESASQSASGQQ